MNRNQLGAFFHGLQLAGIGWAWYAFDWKTALLVFILVWAGNVQQAYGEAK